MSITERPAYVLGQSIHAELRLELLHEITFPNFLKAIEIVPKKYVRILDIGCGSGHLEAKLSTIFAHSFFLGIDIVEKRIQEAKRRTRVLQDSNTYEFIQADLTILPMKQLGQFDIVISRFVLSHLASPLKQLDRYLSLVKPKGFFCFEEIASDGSEYFSNKKNEGYQAFIKIVERQIHAQQSSFDIGFQLLSKFTKSSGKILYSQIAQAILTNKRHKSILRLGIEDASAEIIAHISSKKMGNIIDNLHNFEEDRESFGLYTRTVIATVQTEEYSKHSVSNLSKI